MYMARGGGGGCEMEKTRERVKGRSLLGTLASFSLVALLLLGICSAFGGKDPLYRPFCIRRVSFCTDARLNGLIITYTSLILPHPKSCTVGFNLGL